MTEIYLVTGNSSKLRELQAIFPKEVVLKSRTLDLIEIQPKDIMSDEIIHDKLQRAYKAIGKPVIVEDVSAELACLNGLPGPFIKYFEQRLGKGALWQLAEQHKNKSCVIRCTMGYYDGKTEHIVHGETAGHVVPPRGENGFGFDFVFVPDGHSRTQAEMSAEEKNAMSHRFKAASALAATL